MISFPEYSKLNFAVLRFEYSKWVQHGTEGTDVDKSVFTILLCMHSIQDSMFFVSSHNAIHLFT